MREIETSSVDGPSGLRQQGAARHVRRRALDAPIRADDGRLGASASPGLSGDIAIPGDKSMSHRALILGGLAEGTTVIHGLLEGDDVLHTAAAVRAFGATVERAGEGHWTVTGTCWRSPAAPIDCGNSGTSARLLMGAAAGFPLEARFIGDASLSRRPMGRVLEPLRRMGAVADGDTLPVTLRGGQLRHIRHINASASAQVKSALLLAGLRAVGGVEVVEPAASRDHSENMLRAFGHEVEAAAGTIRLASGTLTAAAVEIPGDPSSAAFPLVAALISPGSGVRVRSVMINPLRTGLLETLRAMGADLYITPGGEMGGEAVADIAVRHGPLRGIEVAAERAPSMIDEYPILAVAAAFAQGRTILHGLAELRVKECDRLAAIVQGLRACGVDAKEEGDTLVIDGAGGPPPGGADVAAQGDHRIAMSFLVFGLASLDPVSVDSSASIATSFPGFARLMRTIGARIG